MASEALGAGRILFWTTTVHDNDSDFRSNGEPMRNHQVSCQMSKMVKNGRQVTMLNHVHRYIRVYYVRLNHHVMAYVQTYGIFSKTVTRPNHPTCLYSLVKMLAFTYQLEGSRPRWPPSQVDKGRSRL